MAARKNAERRRLLEDRRRLKNWKRWGPYLAERQWGTVREDYSPDGSCWTYFTHEQSRSRAYRWGEDGILGIADRECRLCFALAMWNRQDDILKERLFGLGNQEGNHGEDVKECYFYLDATPTSSYLKGLYRYPQQKFPYDDLVQENARRTRMQEEYELLDTGVLADGRYFDIIAEYAKAAPDDILIRLSVFNRSQEPARLNLLPTLWFRNTWTFATREEPWAKPEIRQVDSLHLLAHHQTLGNFHLLLGKNPGGPEPELLLTDNETNNERLFGAANANPYVKDAFHDYVVHGRQDAVNPEKRGTKAAANYLLEILPGKSVVLNLRLFREGESHPQDPLGREFERIFEQRIQETSDFYASVFGARLRPGTRQVMRQGCAGLLWNRQFYYYVVQTWLNGDPGTMTPPPQRQSGRNSTWRHLFNRNVISMPDKWEYPWYAAWDLGFQMVAMAQLDGDFAKNQLVLLLREWFMNPNGQLPAYEFCFSDVNPPVHAWAAWRVYKITAPAGKRDWRFLARVFQKLLLNFTWWVNRKDVHGRQIFTGGFLGMDNVGVIDRNLLVRHGLQQADATAWVAFFCTTMLAIALELANFDPSYEDLATKFFYHFIAISDAINSLGGTGLWDERDGLYYDQLMVSGRAVQLRIRSLVSLLPLIAVEVLDDRVLQKYEGFSQRLSWFLENRKDLAKDVSYMDRGRGPSSRRLRLLAIPSQQRLERVLSYLLDENEFLSPYGIRSLSMYHRDHPYVIRLEGQEHMVDYEPGDSHTSDFGGNSNWRGPVWFPINYLLIEALERYHHFYGNTLQVECPTGSGRKMNLSQVADEIKARLCRIFIPDAQGVCPWQGQGSPFNGEANWKDLVLFHEYFNGDTGKGHGAAHQTGWTALVVRLLADFCRQGRR